MWVLSCNKVLNILRKLVKSTFKYLIFKELWILFSEENIHTRACSEFCILSQDSFETAVNALFEKRANAPYTFCRDCASELLNVQRNTGYSLDYEDQVRLQKMAGGLHFNTEAAADAINKRADYLLDRRGQYKHYQALKKSNKKNVH